jgi:mRNA interferase MazF
MAKGDIILISFPFNDLIGNKLRPATIIIETSYDVTVCFITSQLQWQENTDIVLLPHLTYCSLVMEKNEKVGFIVHCK